MSKKIAVNPKLKLVLGIAVPVLVMIVTVCMVGVSFAWFSDDATVNIATIELTTKEVFTIAIDNVNDADPNHKYQGETALRMTAQSTSVTDEGVYLVCDYRAAQLGLSGTETYIGDKAFSFKTTFALSANDNATVDFTVTLDTAKIEDSSNFIMDSYGISDVDEVTVQHAEDMSYAFTWYMTKTASGGNEDLSTLYTPYGTMYFNGTDASGVAIAKTDSTYATNFPSILNVEPSAITNFDPDESATYNLYIVFAPQELYWMQYISADRDLSLSDVYTAQEIAYITTSALPEQVYYSSYGYLGSEFSFTASIRVETVHWQEEANA